MEAMFLTVWLRRQEAEVQKTQLLAQGLADAATEKSNISKNWGDYTAAVFPFLKLSRAAEKEKMVKVLKDSTKYAFVFDPISYNPLRERAQKMASSNVGRDVRQMLQKAAAAQPTRKGKLR